MIYRNCDTCAIIHCLLLKSNAQKNRVSKKCLVHIWSSHSILLGSAFHSLGAWKLLSVKARLRDSPSRFSSSLKLRQLTLIVAVSPQLSSDINGKERHISGRFQCLTGGKVAGKTRKLQTYARKKPQNVMTF